MKYIIPSIDLLITICFPELGTHNPTLLKLLNPSLKLNLINLVFGFEDIVESCLFLEACCLFSIFTSNEGGLYT